MEQQQIIDWIMRGGILGLAIWAIKGFIREKTAKQSKVADQYLSLSEIECRCKDSRMALRIEFTERLEHLAALVEAENKNGWTNYRELQSTMQETQNTLIQITSALSLLLQNHNTGMDIKAKEGMIIIPTPGPRGR